MKKLMGLTIIFAMLLVHLSTFDTYAAVVSGDYSYVVKDGNATLVGYHGVEKDVIIPEVIDGYAVTGIGEIRPSYSGITVFEDGVESVIIPNSITYIGHQAFYECSSLTSITIPESVTEIGQYAFYRCEGLTSVSILNQVVGWGMFANCESLAEVHLGENVMTIDRYAFGLCKSLKSITLPSKVETIGIGAFGTCESLTTINIPESVVSIDYNAFQKCENLTNVIFNNPNTQFQETGTDELPLLQLKGTFDQCDNLTTMYAFTGSQAQDFAQSRSLRFVPITRLQLNGEKLTFDVPPILEKDRVLVPMRKIFETLGAQIEWDGETGTVTATKGGTEITLQIGNTQMTVNGRAVTLDVPPQIELDRTLVPARAVSESLGADVQWDGDTQTAIITTE